MKPIDNIKTNTNAVHGQIVAIRGAPGQGKTHIARALAADMLSANGRVVWVDADRTLRLDLPDLRGAIIMRPNGLDQLVDWLRRLLGAPTLAGVVIDSLDALPLQRTDHEGPRWKWRGEDALFQTLREHAKHNVTVVYTEHAQSFNSARPTPISRLSRQLSTTLRVVASPLNVRKRASARLNSLQPRSRALRAPTDRTEARRCPRS